MTGKSKYRNKPVDLDGHRFASQAEARRYLLLALWQRSGVITELRLQVPFVLAPAVLHKGATRKTPALRYFADFVYLRDGVMVVEDVKGGPPTQAYKIKQHLMAVQGHHITEVRQ